jgi:glycosyltransferase involved in cell wall biosynthesis
MQENSLVSVIIPVYNVGSFLGECLASLTVQSYANFEVLLVNDCSPDNSQAVIEEYCRKDKRFRAITNKKRLGVSASRNRAVEEARGRYICFVDGDDFIDSEFIETLLAPFLGKTPIDFSACFAFTYANGKYSVQSFCNLNYVRTESHICRFADAVSYLPSFTSMSWAFMFSRAFLSDNALFYPEGIQKYEDDYLFWHALALSRNGFYHTRKMVYYYRRHVGAVMANPSLHQTDFIPVWLANVRLFKKFGLWSGETAENTRKRIYGRLQATLKALLKERDALLKKRRMAELKELIAAVPAKKHHALIRFFIIRQPLFWSMSSLLMLHFLDRLSLRKKK